MSLAAEIMRELEDGALFTPLAERLSGQRITACLDERAFRFPDAGVRNLLGEVPRFRRAGYRTGRLVTSSGMEVAQITSVYLPARISSLACWLLELTSVPLGRVLAPFGARREQLECLPACGNEALVTRARLWLPCPDDPDCEVPVALATERIARPWLEHVRTGVRDQLRSGV